MIDFLTGLLVFCAAVTATACAVAKLIIESGECKIEDRPQFSILHSKFSIHTAVFVFSAAIAVQYAGAKHGGTNSPPLRGASVNSQLFPSHVLARVGTNETFSFAAPSDATVQREWLAFGAANDWFPVETNSLSSPGKWAFPLGTDSVSRLAVFSSGTARPRIKDVETFLSPLSASIGIAPSSRHGLLAEGDRPSVFWHCLTPENSLVLTWQNVLLWRDASSPVSFQSELFENGDVVFRYDLGRLSVPVVSNVVVGVSADGVGNVMSQLPTNVTSLTWRRVDPEDADDPDRDGDGISTADEISAYGTDPHSADTDRDGLSDYEELFVHGTDPLDPNSVSAIYSDGLAVKIGGLDLFSCPSGSTNTVLEHVFYSGTTNGAFSYPQSSDGMAVLRVSVSGSGSGDLVVGSQVVPLLAPPQLRSAPPSPAPQLLVPVPKGRAIPVYIRGDDTLAVSLYSDDFAFGELPSLAASRRVGWVDFPYAKATEPCMHDLCAKQVRVSLDPGRDAQGLACTWSSADGVAVSQTSPLSAMITGSFPNRSTVPVTYTLSHPKALFGQSAYQQNARFCPRLPEGEENPEDGPPCDSEHGDDGEDDSWCWCGCTCCTDESHPCQCHDGNWPAQGYSPETCPQHGVPSDECEHLHRQAYTNLLQVAELPHVLKLHDPSESDEIFLDVPDGFSNCCPCPGHWTNYVSIAAKGYSLSVRKLDGERFTRTEEDCSVHVTGLAPSKAVGDAHLSFCRTGSVYMARNYTVLGVGIDAATEGQRAFAARNPVLGIPISCSMNKDESTLLFLRVDVDLPEGNVHVGLRDATSRFQMWIPSENGYCLLLDSETKPNADMDVRRWRRLAARCAQGRRLPVYVTSEGSDFATIDLGFAAPAGASAVCDAASCRIVSVRRIAETVTTQTAAVGGEARYVNPSCAVLGEATPVRVSCEFPAVPSSEVKWKVVSGTAAFSGGDTGYDVNVVAGGDEGEEIVLEVDFCGIPGRAPRFTLNTVGWRDTTVYPCVISSEDEPSSITRDHVVAMVADVNRIFRQVGMRFTVAETMQFATNNVWAERGLIDKRVGRNVRNTMQKTGGVEVYFIPGLGRHESYADNEPLGSCNKHGIIVKNSANFRTLAHELGHACRLVDIFVDMNGLEDSTLLNQLANSDMPADWNNGVGGEFFYETTCLYNTIPDLLMYGHASECKADIPSGAIRGITKDQNSAANFWAGMIPVGFFGMHIPPASQ